MHVVVLPLCSAHLKKVFYRDIQKSVENSTVLINIPVAFADPVCRKCNRSSRNTLLTFLAVIQQTKLLASSHDGFLRSVCGSSLIRIYLRWNVIHQLLVDHSSNYGHSNYIRLWICFHDFVHYSFFMTFHIGMYWKEYVPRPLVPTTWKRRSLGSRQPWPRKMQQHKSISGFIRSDVITNRAIAVCGNSMGRPTNLNRIM